ncbi:DNA-binding transcriptional MerR regulator [Dietzia sp. 2505]|uniref:MerR family transcriptional regulator n=1 Tax=Dietzia sp. 2505 TaxID=3156457 RepID=UPI00339291C3
MRSSDLARLAGITVRTLRHYHQVGVLPEPPRSSNSYRDYGTRDLVMVLRIRRLADLGLSLDQISTILHSTGPAPGELLASLDAEITEQIENLSRKRELLAHLARHEAPPDLPPEVAAAHSSLRSAGLPTAAADLDRDHMLLLAQLTGAAGQAYLRTVYDIITTPATVEATVAVMTAWAALDDTSTDREIHEVSERLLDLLTPVMAELATGGPELPDLTEAQYRDTTTGYLTSAQKQVLELVRAHAEGVIPHAGDREESREI